MPSQTLQRRGWLAIQKWCQMKHCLSSVHTLKVKTKDFLKLLEGPLTGNELQDLTDLIFKQLCHV